VPLGIANEATTCCSPPGVRGGFGMNDSLERIGLAAAGSTMSRSNMHPHSRERIIGLIEYRQKRVLRNG
jgi:hypothetical protein